MTEEQFWKLVENAKKAAADDKTERAGKLVGELKKLPAETIKVFAEIFHEKDMAAYSWDLWAIAYLANGGCSDDSFWDFRGWLISEGQDVYERALIDPDSLADNDTLGEPDECMLEDYLYAASEAYKCVAKQDLPPHTTGVGEPSGEEWDENNLPELEARFPRVWKWLVERDRL